jgi:ABC-type branched-subunit amino acid transport system ATPase component
LEVHDIYTGYRPGEDILKGVSLHVLSGEMVCVIGPNGAGKSTVFKALYGLLPVRRGRVLFDGKDITNIRPQDALRKADITIVPQLRSVFPEMSVEENLRLGMYLVRNKRRVQARVREVLELFPPLAERAKQVVGTMSGGEQRMVEMGRALMWEPRLLLMDEPSAGLAPFITKTIFAKLDELNRELGLTVLMIEQNARQGLQVSNRGYVLEMGRPTYEGPSDELLANHEVRRTFLGAR